MHYLHDTQTIVISQESFKSKDFNQIVNSNIQYITKLFQHNVSDNDISEEALKSYYIDYYLSHITHGGFSNFIEHIKSRPKTLYYLKEGLKSIHAKNHLELLIHAIQIDSETLQSFSLFNTLFSEFQERENLLELNGSWIFEHSQLQVIKGELFDQNIQEQIINVGNEERHTKIIKELCNIADEEFIRVTAGEKKNLYNHGSWYFKTDHGYYYMVEKDYIVTMYNSSTKEVVVKGKLSSTHSITDNYKSMFSKLLG
jgi:hypothetical protein